MNSNDTKLQSIRHSLAHVLAYSVKQLYPGAQNAIGPATENGFYQDFELPQPISVEELPKIEEKMREVLREWGEFKKTDVTIEEARKLFADNPYKLELAEEFASEGKQLTVYRSGDFDDLCKGGHTQSVKDISPDSFKLTKTAGAYWRGDENNIMLTRIYGVAFDTKDEVNAHLTMLAEAKERDHRKLGKELDLFTFSEKVGSGLPLFTPRGTILRNKLNDYVQQLRSSSGYDHVSIPHITKRELYETSGHWDKFGDELFLVESQETSDKFVLKPMNCPHHTQIFAAKPRSYKELPMKFMETTMQYRDEKSGELHGLSRVRSISIDDTHVFCTSDQIGSIATELIQMVKDAYKTFDMKLKFRLSFRDEGNGYLGDEALWETAQDTIEKLAREHDLDYFIAEGEAAFYGPKIDFIAVDAIGREWQLSTVQVDFVQPQRFELEYVNDKGQKETPVMLHYAILGSIERFLSVYIEHTAGHFPFWLAPEQVRILTVNDSVKPYAQKVKSILDETVVMQPLKYNEVRSTIDDRKESLGKKIRLAESEKTPIIIIVGPKDQDANQVSVRRGGEESKVNLDELQAYMENISNDA